MSPNHPPGLLQHPSDFHNPRSQDDLPNFILQSSHERPPALDSHTDTHIHTMAGKKGGENSKKVAGNAKKAEAAASKAAAEDAKREAAESAEWSKGSKSNAKK